MVQLHDRHGSGLQLRGPARDSVSIRRGRSRRLAVRRAHVQSMDSRARTRHVQGIFFAGAHLAGGLTPLAVVALQPHLHWRWIFVCFGLVGFLWAAAWSAWFRDDPTEHPGVNAAELEQIVAERPPDSGHVEGWAYWGRLLRDPTCSRSASCMPRTARSSTSVLRGCRRICTSGTASMRHSSVSTPACRCS